MTAQPSCRRMPASTTYLRATGKVMDAGLEPVLGPAFGRTRGPGMTMVHRW